MKTSRRTLLSGLVAACAIGLAKSIGLDQKKPEIEVGEDPRITYLRGQKAYFDQPQTCEATTWGYDQTQDYIVVFESDGTTKTWQMIPL